MKLFEITNGYIGESYVRCYAWAESTEQALALAREQFRAEEEGRKYGVPRTEYWERLEIVELFDSSTAPFATRPSDDGWPEVTDTTGDTR